MLADQDDVWLPNKLPLVRELFAGEAARPYLVVLDARIVDEERARRLPIGAGEAPRRAGVR